MAYFSDILFLSLLFFHLPILYLFGLLALRSWLSYRLRSRLQRKGYKWLSLGGCMRLQGSLGERAGRLPPSEQIESLPGYQGDVKSLIEIGQNIRNRES